MVRISSVAYLQVPAVDGVGQVRHLEEVAGLDDEDNQNQEEQHSDHPETGRKLEGGGEMAEERGGPLPVQLSGILLWLRSCSFFISFVFRESVRLCWLVWSL